MIGGGYTGLTAALFLAGEHQMDVRVLEAVPIAWGASRQNGGFCGLGVTALDYRAMAEDLHFLGGLNICKGRVTNSAVARALGYDCVEPMTALVA